MARSWLDALLGRLFNGGTELELKGGINFVGFDISLEGTGENQRYRIEATGGGDGADLSDDDPPALEPGNIGNPGEADEAARIDHVHELPVFGTGANDICRGNDARLGEVRTAVTGSASAKSYRLLLTADHTSFSVATGDTETFTIAVPSSRIVGVSLKAVAKNGGGTVIWLKRIAADYQRVGSGSAVQIGVDVPGADALSAEGFDIETSPSGNNIEVTVSNESGTTRTVDVYWSYEEHE